MTVRGGAPDGDRGFVLVHGGVHRASSWSPLLPHLDRPAVAIDLPGRDASMAELRRLTREDFVDSAVADIRASGLRRITLVGHSLAGVILPEITVRLAEIIHHVVFISCAIPPPGRSIVEITPVPFRLFARWRFRRGVLVASPFMARRMLCNRMNDSQTRFVLDQLCDEAPGILTTPVPPYRWPDQLGRTYVSLKRDRCLPQFYQRRYIRNLGSCETVAFDGCHDAFVSDPAEVARILNRYGPPSDG